MAHVNLIRLAPDCARIASLVSPGKIPGPSRWKDVRASPLCWRVRLRGERLSPRQMTNCKALLEDDIPFAIAIGVCVASSLVLPPGGIDNSAGDDKDAFGGADDIRSAAMGIISFIPFFNWLNVQSAGSVAFPDELAMSRVDGERHRHGNTFLHVHPHARQAWVFAWLDTRRTRYLVYAIVYAAPYLKNDFSLSPDESWLPLVSLAACIVHVQLDTNNASIEIADNEDSSASSSEKNTSGPSVVDKLPIKPFLRKMEKLLEFKQASREKVGSDRPAEEKSEEERVAEKEIHDWPKTELREWDRKLGNFQGEDGSDEQNQKKHD